MRRGQALTEYIILVGLVAAAFIALFIYIGRSNQGNIRDQAEQLDARQYDPDDTTLSNSEQKQSNFLQESTSATSTTHGNLQDDKDREKMKELQKNMSDTMMSLYQLYQQLEDIFVYSATTEARKVLNGQFMWNPDESDIIKKFNEINAASEPLAGYSTDLEAEQKKWEESRTKDSSSSSQRGMTDTDTTTTRRINERLGPLR